MKKIAKWRGMPLFTQKIVRVMKISVFLVLVCTMQLSASVILGQQVNLKSNEMSVRQVFKELKVQTGTFFMYTEKEIDRNLTVDVDFSNVSLEEALEEICKQASLRYEIVDDYVLITKSPIVIEKQVEQEKKEIKGTVTDVDGKPLPGVSVVVKGTMLGVATDVDGKYIIRVHDNNIVLVFSFVGMVPQEITYAGQASLDVKMVSDAEQVEEVVVTGYQVISKERATGAFSTINKDALEVKLASDLTQVMEGLTTGLVADKEGNVTIRGTSTFKAEAHPLIVLDGFPYDGTLNTINADNIENITILKDGVAASIYGARSANGVIVVTTKRGREGDLKVSYKGTVSVTQKTNISDMNRSSTSEYIDGQIAKFDSAPYYYYPTPNRMAQVDYLLMQSGYGVMSRDEALAEIDKLRDNNLYKQVEKYGLRNKFTHQHNVNISGGGERNLFNASVNFFDEKGEELMSKNNRFIFDLKNTWKFKKNITFSTSANIVYRKSEKSKTNILDLVTYSGLQPYDNIVDASGKPVDNVDFYVSPSRESVYVGKAGMKPWNYSPLKDMREGNDEVTDFQTRLTAQLNVKVFEGLDVLIGGVWARGNRNEKGFYSADAYAMRIGYNDATSISDLTKHYLPEGGLLDETRNINESYTFRSQINFNRSFNDKHRLTSIVGSEIRRDQFDNVILPTKVGYNPISGDFIFVDNSNMSPSISTNGNDYLLGRWSHLPRITEGGLDYRDNRFVSWYGNSSYEYDNRFLLSGSVRLDLTNFFGTDDKYRYKPTWSLGLTHKLSNEAWFDVDFIDRLNLRGSYGINGNISMTEGPFMILFSEGYNQTAQGISYRIQYPANNQLRWEKTSTSNIGFDATMLNGRMNLSVDAYRKHSVDLLAPDATDRTTGVGSLSKNVGEITNDGVEIALNTDVVKSNGFKYNTVVNASYNKNKVNEYNVKRSYATSYLYGSAAQGVNEKGYPVKGLWGFRGAPLSDKGEAQAYDAEGNLIHPNSVSKEDVVFLGSSIPKFNIAWVNNFSYKNFEASFMFVGSFGAKFWGDAFTGNNITNRHVSKAWKKAGDEKHTIYPRVSYLGSGWWGDKADYFILNANYVKLRDVTLSYNVPKEVLQHIGFSTARVFVQGRNLMTFRADGVDIDPETGSLPLKREFYAGVSFAF